MRACAFLALINLTMAVRSSTIYLGSLSPSHGALQIGLDIRWSAMS